MRVEGQAKAGFYPTPPEVARLIGSCLVAEEGSHLLDPCCGTGEALEIVRRFMTGSYRTITHGVELEQERGEAAGERLQHVLLGDSLKARAKGSFGLLYLNPPYDQADGGRLELRFLWHWQRSLMPGGVLVFVVPERYLGEYEATLTSHFEKVSIHRFPGEHYDAFKQVVVFGIKRLYTASPGRLPDIQGDLAQGCVHYTVPTCKDAPKLYLTGQEPEALVLEAREKGCWRKAWDLLNPPDPHAFRPLMPLRKGHLALMMALGLLNNCVIEGGGRRLLVRGRVRKEVVEHEERDEKGVKTIARDVLKTEVTALDLDTGELIEVA